MENGRPTRKTIVSTNLSRQSLLEHARGAVGQELQSDGALRAQHGDGEGREPHVRSNVWCAMMARHEVGTNVLVTSQGCEVQGSGQASTILREENDDGEEAAGSCSLEGCEGLILLQAALDVWVCTSDEEELGSLQVPHKGRQEQRRDAEGRRIRREASFQEHLELGEAVGSNVWWSANCFFHTAPVAANGCRCHRGHSCFSPL
mmetsp:Transcript_98969/g.206283  ORF Transcript_98969/g.206283 Transcript_98969/m.206283 type:complete len:204 (-) Transcript_98969:3167-3778(-)